MAHVRSAKTDVHIVNGAMHRHFAFAIASAKLHDWSRPAEHFIDAFSDVVRDPHVAFVHFDQNWKRRRTLTLEDGLLAPSRARFVVAERDSLDAADQIGQRRVLDQVLQQLPVRGTNELNTTLGDRSTRQRFGFGTDFIDDDHLGHVILHGFDHDAVLHGRIRNLHSPRAPDGGVRDVAITADLVAGVDDHHAFFELIAQHTRHFADDRRLSDTRTSQKQHALAAR
mmetsp:Transcript_5795/g.22903  ORF Transcript_5795/g.22903 Transcript_5795/m.22903 type:complete len:226 (-) Transcript_5795:487-1164(-)